MRKSEDIPGTPDSRGSNDHVMSKEGKQLVAAARARRKVDFSVAMAIVCFGSLSFGLTTIYFCKHHGQPPYIHEQFYTEVNSSSYLWPGIAFATAVALNAISWLFEQRPTRKQLCFLAMYISTLAAIYEFLAWLEIAPIYITATGRPVSILRYVMWAHTTPGMLYALSLISDLRLEQVFTTIAVDMFMILVIIPGELIPSWHRWIFNFASFAVFPFIFKRLWEMYTSAIDTAGDSSDYAGQSSLRALRGFTATFWSVFPIIWTLVQLQLISLQTEELLWSIADICGKVIFSSSLLHSNFMTIESRRLQAMKIIEEGNRLKVIQELQQLVDQKEGFIALMSHELRTPLNGIIGLSNSLLLDVPPESEVHRTMSTIRNSGARLLTLINDILDAAALRRGKLVVGKNRVLLQHAVDDVLELTSLLVRPGVILMNRISGDIPPVIGDVSRIVQVLYNLLGNACKFTEKGEIWVDATCNQAQGQVIVAVHDTGIGIPPNKLDDIFSPFEQVDMSVRRQYGGTGLGLNLAKQLIEAHEGSISVSSIQGQGSTFVFTLPMWKPGMTSPRADALAENMSTEGFKFSKLREVEYNKHLAGGHGNGNGNNSTIEPLSSSITAMAMAQVSSKSDNARINPHRHVDAVRSDDANDPTTLPRNLSAVELQQRLENDAIPENMLSRLSLDAQIRKSLEIERKLKKAPQQLDPGSAAASFLTASAIPSFMRWHRRSGSTLMNANGTGKNDESSLFMDGVRRRTNDGTSSNSSSSSRKDATRSSLNDKPAADLRGTTTTINTTTTTTTINTTPATSVTTTIDVDEDGRTGDHQISQQSASPPRPPLRQQHQNCNNSDDAVAAHTAETKQHLNINTITSTHHEDVLLSPHSPPRSPRNVPPTPTSFSRYGSWTHALEAVKKAEESGEIRVLSVDDCSVNQMVIDSMLRRSRFEVSKASDGARALEMIEESIHLGQTPDVVLLDVMMPGMSGYDVVRAMRQRYPTLMLPVILVSANGAEDQVVEGLRAGANDYITKPFGRGELVARIVTQMRTKQFAESAAACAAAAAAGGSEEINT